MRAVVVFGIICAVVSVIVIAIVVTVVVVVCVALKAKSDFETFTAEVRADYGRGHVTYTKQFAFDTKKWFSEQYINGKLFSRIYRRGFADYAVVCNRVGDHDGCYSITGNYGVRYYVSWAYDKMKSEVPCPSIHAPVLTSGATQRKPEKCDMYQATATSTTSSTSILYQEWIESDTTYPVLSIAVTREGSTVVSNVSSEYTYFNAKKPEDQSGLNPPEGAKVYDFRTYSTSYVMEGIVDMVTRVVNFFRGVDSPKNAAAEALSHKFEQAKLLDSRRQLMTLIPVVGGPAIGETPKSVKQRDDTPIPASFDARTKWDRCSEVIGYIYDQKDCGSCWAMSTASVVSDRACIKGLSKTHYSPQYMVSCYYSQVGCSGGFGASMWDEIRDVGLVTESCYPFAAKDQECPSTCANGTAITSEMMMKVPRFYSPWAEDDDARVKAIQREIMENGPVATSILVFSKFSKMSKGTVYKRSSGETFSGGHMVRIIGWGTQNGEDYWLVANSWGTSWNENGFFKIRRGKNELNIENTVAAGLFA